MGATVDEPLRSDDGDAQADGAQELDGAPDSVRHQHRAVLGIVHDLTACKRHRHVCWNANRSPSVS